MRALVVDQGSDRGSLAAVRALARDGWHVGVGSPFRGIAGSSRAVRRWHPVPAAECGVEEYIDAVARAVADGGYEVVFTSDDIGILALSRHRDRIGAIFPYADDESVVHALDKLHLTRAAERTGLEVPLTYEVGPDTLETAEWPLVVKPRLQASLEVRVSGRLNACIARDRDQAAEAIESIRAAGVEPLLQEVLDGALVSCQAVVDREGVVVARAQQVAARSWPPEAGVSVRARTVTVDPDLADGIARLLSGLGWFGLASFQFLDPGDGRAPRLIDLNGRFYGSMALAIASGPNYPAIWACLATGRPIGHVPASRPGVRFQWLKRDVQASMRTDGVRGVSVALLATPRAVHSVWSARDPLPAVRHYGHELLRRNSRDSR